MKKYLCKPNHCFLKDLLKSTSPNFFINTNPGVNYIDLTKPEKEMKRGSIPLEYALFMTSTEA